MGWLYHRYGEDIKPGTNLIIDEIHNPQKIVPIRMFPLIFGSTLLTHLFGGSAGREGTAIQMGASLSDQLGHFLAISARDRRVLLLAGTGAAFGAATSAPFAGIFFGLEIVHAGKLYGKFEALIECALASFLAYGVTLVLGAPHLNLPRVVELHFSPRFLVAFLIAIFAFGALTQFFVMLTHAVERVLSARVRYSPLRPLLGGILLVFCFQFFHWEDFEGLSLPLLQDAFVTTAPLRVFAIKLGLTAITLGSGFKGGEFIPLVVIGATFGSALSGFFSLDPAFLASLGFIALFASAAKAPLSCSILAVELFGWKIAIFALVCCYVSTAVSGKAGIYQSRITQTG